MYVCRYVDLALLLTVSYLGLSESYNYKFVLLISVSRQIFDTSTTATLQDKFWHGIRKTYRERV